MHKISVMTLAFSCVAFCCFATPKPGLELYVSPSGNDAWSGTAALSNDAGTDGPPATLEAARDAVRRLKDEKSIPEGGMSL